MQNALILIHVKQFITKDSNGNICSKSMKVLWALQSHKHNEKNQIIPVSANICSYETKRIQYIHISAHALFWSLPSGSVEKNDLLR